MSLFGSFRRPFLTESERSQLDDGLAHAIRHAGAPIALRIDARASGNPHARASALFAEWTLSSEDRTRAVLLYACAATQKFAVAAGEEIRAAAPPAFWTSLESDLTRHFTEARYCDGLFKAIATIATTQSSVFVATDRCHSQPPPPPEESDP